MNTKKNALGIQYAVLCETIKIKLLYQILFVIKTPNIQLPLITDNIGNKVRYSLISTISELKDSIASLSEIVIL